MDSRIIEVLCALACEYEQQMKLFPSFVAPADELAQQFSDLEDMYLTDSNDLAPDAAKHFKTLRDLFDDLQTKDADLAWTAAALKDSPIWARIRIEARAMLEKIGVEFHNPDLGFLSFVPASDDL